MLRDRHKVDKFFMGIQELTNAMNGDLAQIDRLLDDDELYQRVKGDLEKRHQYTRVTGHQSMPGEVILRMLVVKHMYNLSYGKTDMAVAIAKWR